VAHFGPMQPNISATYMTCMVDNNVIDGNLCDNNLRDTIRQHYDNDACSISEVDCGSNNSSIGRSQHCRAWTLYGSAFDATGRIRISDAMEQDHNHLFSIRLSSLASEDAQLSGMEQGRSQVWAACGRAKAPRLKVSPPQMSSVILQRLHQMRQQTFCAWA